jgi:protein-S-isoprenylcysteine O-methyltransferase Ste14
MHDQILRSGNDTAAARRFSFMHRRWLFAVPGSIAYLALAVWGAGGLSAFVAHPARVVTALLVAALVAASLRTRANMSAGEREDRGNRWIIAAIVGLALLIAWIPAYTERLGFWVLDRGDGVRWTGVALFAIGGVLRLWPVFVLGGRFSALVAIQRDHTLVTSGIYSVIRHPSYLGLLVNAFGWALVFRSGAGLLLTALMIIPVVARIRAEEALLRLHFGVPYDAWRARTWRLIPGLY